MSNRLLDIYMRSEGFTLAELMIATAIMSGLLLLVMQMSNDQSKLASKATLDSDVALLNSQVLTYLTLPNHCNANFYNKPLNGHPSAVYTCGASTCHGANATPSLPVAIAGGPFGGASTDNFWLQSITKISSKLRISYLSYSVPPVTASGVKPFALSTLTFIVTYQTRLNTSGSMSSPMKTFQKIFYVPVIVNGSTNLITGCSKTWNSTELY